MARGFVDQASVGGGCRPVVAALVFGALCLPAPRAGAHPLLQDTMRIEVARAGVSLQVTAAAEEILVAATAGGQGAASWNDKVRRHGEYLLRHLWLEVDGGRMPGRLGEPPAAALAGPAGPATYRIDYALEPPPGGSRRPPRRIVVRQQALREIGLALGGPWEVTYVVSAVQQGRPGVETHLLTAAEPLTLTLDRDWSADPREGQRPLGQGRLAWAYLRQGLAHILRGFDHLLFVAALVLAAATLGDLIKVVVAFTLAHAITLTLCALRLLRVREEIVEPLIAASIVVVALQNLLFPASSRRSPRLVVAFLFGLLHGCGFASGALQAMRDLPAAGIGLAVAAFSLGVELGHQVVVIPTFMLLNRIRERASPRAVRRLRRIGSATIAVAGALYFWSALRG